MAKVMDQPSIYFAEYSMLTERLVNDKDAVDMISEFWDKLAHIEYNYARSIAQLCNSRQGKLFKMFNDKPSECFRPLQSLWGAVLEDMLTYSESHLNVAYTLQREVKPALSSFSQEDLAKQIEVAVHGKKVMTGLKDDLGKLDGERKKVYKTMLSENAEEMKEISDDVNDNVSKTKQLQKLWIRSKDSHAHAFSVTMPSILEELNNTSVRRVEAVCNSVGHFTSLITSTSTSFSTTSSTLLAAQSAAESVRYRMSCSSPEPPGDLGLNMSRSEMMQYCQTPAKKFFNNIQERVFPANVGNMFVNPMRDRAGSDNDNLNNPLRDISQKVATMWSNIRTRTLSGNLIESPPEDLDTADDALLDPEDEDILDPGIVKGTAALEDQDSMAEDPLENILPPVLQTKPVDLTPSVVDISPPQGDVTPAEVYVISSPEEINSPEVDLISSPEESTSEKEELVDISLEHVPAGRGEVLNERDIQIISLSNDPDAAEEYVVVNE